MMKRFQSLKQYFYTVLHRLTLFMKKKCDVALTENSHYTFWAKRDQQTRYLSQAIQLEESVNPHIIRSTMTMVSLALLVFVVWAGLTNINEVARTTGEVVPRGHHQQIQHLEGGIVQTINVEEGQVVEKDQTLLTLTDSVIKEDLERLQAKQMSLEMHDERLRAFIGKRDMNFDRWPDASPHIIMDQKEIFEGMRAARKTEYKMIEDQIEEKEKTLETVRSDLETVEANLKITRDMHKRRQALHKKGYAPDMKLMTSELQMNNLVGEKKRLEGAITLSLEELQNYRERLDVLSSQQKDIALQDLSVVVNEKAQNHELIEKLQERISRLKIKAPAHGLIKGLSINTIGSVVAPGQTIMEIVPLDEELEVSVKILPQDIGHLTIGQDVQVKFSTFDFSRYGSVKGRLAQISATTFVGENGDRFYKGRVLLEQNYVGEDQSNTIIPGMTVMADIITGKKTVLQYMLKPIHVSLKTAFTER